VWIVTEVIGTKEFRQGVDIGHGICSGEFGFEVAWEEDWR